MTTFSIWSSAWICILGVLYSTYDIVFVRILDAQAHCPLATYCPSLAIDIMISVLRPSITSRGTGGLLNHLLHSHHRDTQAFLRLLSTMSDSSKLTLQSTVTLSSGYKMPLLGFGVYLNDDALPTTLEAFKVGYRHVDSAQYYNNEAQVGEAVRQSKLDRANVFITTKIQSQNHGYENTKKGVVESLARMEFDYVDLFLIHDPLAGKQRRLETYKALLEAKAAGKIRSVGVSNYGIKHLEEIKAAGYEAPSINQIELHPFCQQKDIVKYCAEKNIVVQAYCPLVHGKMDHPVIQEVAAKNKRSAAQVLCRWSLQKGYVPLPKSVTPSRIQSNTELYDFELSAEDMQKLDSLDQGKAGAVSWNPVDAP